MRKGPLNSTNASGFIVVSLAGMASCHLPLLAARITQRDRRLFTPNSGCAGFAGLSVVPGSVGGPLGWLVSAATAGAAGLYPCSFSPPVNVLTRGQEGELHAQASREPLLGSSPLTSIGQSRSQLRGHRQLRGQGRGYRERGNLGPCLPSSVWHNGCSGQGG